MRADRADEENTGEPDQLIAEAGCGQRGRRKRQREDREQTK